MKLIIHAGCHKTATTWFQMFCRRNATVLQENGIYYPDFKGKFQHSFVAWEMQRRDFKGFIDLLQDGAKTVGKHGVVLISGEDFENCLIDNWFAQKVEALAKEEGYDAIEWIFVKRKPIEYIDSIYSELSKSGDVVLYRTLAESAMLAGFFSLSTAHYIYHFVFDIETFCERLSVNGNCSQEILTYEQFKEGFPGRTILARFLTQDRLDTLYESYPKHSSKNTRLSSFRVEVNYAESYCGLCVRDKKLIRRLMAFAIVFPLALIRMKSVERWRSKVDPS